MDPASSVSLLASVWPQEGSKEEKCLNANIVVPKRCYKDWHQKMLTVAQVILTVGEMTAEAVITRRFTKFDALIKNFGCQITALDVQKKVKVKTLFAEAEQVLTACQNAMALIKTHFNKPPLAVCGETLALYAKRVGVDVQVSETFADLVNFRFLNIIFGLKLKGDEEVPVTDVDPLEYIRNTLSCKVSGRLFSFETWVEGVQVKESIKAVSSIQAVANSLNVEHERTARICKMVSQEAVRKASKSSIVTVAQSYSTEAVVRAMKGVLVVKNKLTICGVPIKNAKRDVVFIRMPEEKILTPDEVAALKPEKAVIVLEGYKKEEKPLYETVKEVGVHALLMISLAKVPQYTSDFSQEPLEEDPVLDACAGIREEFRCDHMFCSSVEEVRDV